VAVTDIPSVSTRPVLNPEILPSTVYTLVTVVCPAAALSAGKTKTITTTTSAATFDFVMLRPLCSTPPRAACAPSATGSSEHHALAPITRLRDR